LPDDFFYPTEVVSGDNRLLPSCFVVEMAAVNAITEDLPALVFAIDAELFEKVGFEILDVIGIEIAGRTEKAYLYWRRIIRWHRRW
jgi:hypothetical protein